MAVRLFLQMLPTQVGSFVLTDRTCLDHLRVLRVRPAQAVCFFDGCGSIAQGSFLELSKNQAKFQIDSLSKAERPTRAISVACALLQGKAFESVVRHCAEMGVEAIYPLITERTQAPSKIKFPLERFTAIAIEACKQSGNLFLPRIHEPMKLDLFLQQPKPVIKLLASLEEGARPTAHWLEEKGNGSVALLIGPEGDFSASEYRAIDDQGWKPTRLAPHILRTEVAALVMLAQVVSV